MLEINGWMEALTAQLKEAFGERLLFAGLQGSRRRGEAAEDSDIDVVVVLDQLTAEALRTYRNLVAAQPEGEKACGFICGRAELAAWPKFEIFQLLRETRPYWGDLSGLVPEIGRQDIVDSLKIGASMLYHAAAHTFLYGGSPMLTEAAKGFYKQAFFLLQVGHYLRTGHYADTKKELGPLLDERERAILQTGIEWDRHQEKCAADPESYILAILDWSSELLRTA